AGEGTLLTTAEKERVWAMVAEAAAPGRQLVATTGCESVRETVAMTNRAAELGYHAALVLPPHAYRGFSDSDEALRLFYGAVADRAKIPVIVYNRPQSSGVDLSIELGQAIAEHPNVVGMEECTPDGDKLEARIRAMKG